MITKTVMFNATHQVQ